MLYTIFSSSPSLCVCVCQTWRVPARRRTADVPICVCCLRSNRIISAPVRRASGCWTTTRAAETVRLSSDRLSQKLKRSRSSTGFTVNESSLNGGTGFTGTCVCMAGVSEQISDDRLMNVCEIRLWFVLITVQRYRVDSCANHHFSTGFSDLYPHQ